MGGRKRRATQCPPRATTTAASAPAVPATMKLAPLQRKSSRHTETKERLLVNAIAPATRPVLTRKYVAIAPTSGFARPEVSRGVVGPPANWYTMPVATIVRTSAATLKIVRYSGYCFLTL